MTNAPLPYSKWWNWALYGPILLLIAPFIYHGVRAHMGYIDVIPMWAVSVMVFGALGWQLVVAFAHGVYEGLKNNAEEVA